MPFPSRASSALFVCAFLLTPGSAWAQSTTGSISGSVTDSSNASLTGANVTVTSEETGITRTSATNARGRYHIFDLPPGRIE
jgi:hypothetical protein